MTQTEREDTETCIRQAASGDMDAFARVVRRFQDMAVGYAFSILGDYHLAEDAAQEAFLQAYHDLSRLRSPSAFTAWFRKIVWKYCDRTTRGKRLPTRTAGHRSRSGRASAEPVRGARNG